MKLITTKTKKTFFSITHKTTLVDDDGKTFAIMVGTIDSGRPFGSSNFIIQNKAIFELHKEAAKAQYEEFQSALSTAFEDPKEECDMVETIVND